MDWVGPTAEVGAVCRPVDMADLAIIDREYLVASNATAQQGGLAGKLRIQATTKLLDDLAQTFRVFFDDLARIL